MSYVTRRVAEQRGPNAVLLLVLAALVLVVCLPALAGGLLILGIAYLLASLFGERLPWWPLPLTAAGAISVVLLLAALTGMPPSRLYDDYLYWQTALIAGMVAQLLGREAEMPLPPAALYAAGVAPLAGPGALVCAAVGDLWRRSRELRLEERHGEGVRVFPWVRWLASLPIRHPRDGWAVGRTKLGRVVAILDAEARHHTLLGGATGSGKTWLLRVLIEAIAGRHPLVIIDCKASRLLRRAVEALGGQVWHVQGQLVWDALRGDPSCFADKLLAGYEYTPEAAVYRDAAERHVQWVGVALQIMRAPRDPKLIAQLLHLAAFKRYLAQVAKRSPERAAFISRCLASMTDVEKKGVAGFATRFGVLIEGAAGQSLGTGPSALVLEEVIRANGIVLFSLDAAAYPLMTRRLGAIVLLDLVRVAGLLQAEGWGDDPRRCCYVVVDEFAALGHEGRHVIPVLSRTREAGMACVLATQGLADLERMDRTLVQQVLQNTGVRMALRQGSTEDADRWSAVLGRYRHEELARAISERQDTGGGFTRWRADVLVPAEDLMALGPGEAIVQIAPLGPRHGLLERVCVVRPRPLPVDPARSNPPPPDPVVPAVTEPEAAIPVEEPVPVRPVRKAPTPRRKAAPKVPNVERGGIPEMPR